MRRNFITASLLLIVAAFLFAGDVFPFLRGGFGWQWPYHPVPFIRLIPLGIAIGLTGAVAILLWRFRLRWQIAWAIISVPVLTLAALAARHDDPGQMLILRTLSPLTTGAHAAAAAVAWDERGWLEWAQVMHSFEGRIAHVNLAPPALPMLYAATADLLAWLPGAAEMLGTPIKAAQCHNYAMLTYTPAEWAAAWIGVLMPVWAGLSVIPLAALARRFYPDQVPAVRTALLLYPLIPALLVFTPTWNTVYPLFSLTALWLLDRGLREPGGRRLLSIAAGGVITGVSVFINFAFVPLGLLFGLYALAMWYGDDRPGRRPFGQIVRAGLVFAGGVALPWIGYGVLTGSWPWELLSASMSMHLELERDYLPWIALHAWDWMLWTGPPLIGLWLLSAHQGWRSAAGRLSVTLLLTLLILLVSNFARGETGRVWTLFAPFVVLAAAGTLAQGRSSRIELAFAWAAQAAWLIALVAVIEAVVVELTPPPDTPAPHAEVRSVEAQFASAFTLVGWEASAQPEGILLNLNWRADAPMFTPYWISALLVDSAGQAVGPAVVWQPDGTRFPTTCWMPGAVIGDRVMLPLPRGADSEAYWISLAAFADDFGINRLPVRVQGQAPSDQVGLGPVVAAR
jgi:hypothetical protein